jgi:hypothetical protein
MPVKSIATTAWRGTGSRSFARRTGFGLLDRWSISRSPEPQLLLRGPGYEYLGARLPLPVQDLALRQGDEPADCYPTRSEA